MKTRADHIRHFHAIRKEEVKAMHPHLRDAQIHDYARAWAELDASEAMSQAAPLVQSETMCVNGMCGVLA